MKYTRLLCYSAALIMTIQLAGCRPQSLDDVIGVYHGTIAGLDHVLILEPDHQYSHRVSDQVSEITMSYLGKWSASLEWGEERVFLHGFQLYQDKIDLQKSDQAQSANNVAAPAFVNGPFGRPKLLFDPDQMLSFRKVPD